MTRTRQERIRLGVIFILVILFFAAAVARLIHLQVYEHDRYSSIVEKQSSGRVSIPAERGLIYDRNGRLVAKNVIGSSLYAYPSDDAQLRAAGAFLDKYLHLTPGEAITKYKLDVDRFRWIKRRLNDAEAKQLEKMTVPGLYLRYESQREYPFGTVGKQILGFTDIDNIGQSGFELYYDSLLTGKNGFADIRRDGLNKTYRIKEEALVKPLAGNSLVLTVDWRMQDIVEEELRKAVDTFGAQRGMAVFVDCNTGDIVSIAHYDPSDEDREKPTKLRALNDQFEPGSVFKVFTAAGVFDAGIVDFNRRMDCENGAWRLKGHTLHDDKKHGMLTFREIIELSSNIGIAKWAIEVDGDDMFKVYKRFGFGKRLRCGLPGEASGRLVPPGKWSDYNIAAAAMGHSIAVTPLQLASAMAAVANGGDLLRPHVILGHVDAEGRVRRDIDRPVINRVVQNASLDSLKAFLRGVVERGTAKVVNSEVVSIAGKTGTAQLPDTVNKVYFQNKFVATFAGFFPAENPTIAGAVILIDPQPIHYGGLTSGPAFRRIAERYALVNAGLLSFPEKSFDEKDRPTDSTTTAPNLVGASQEFAQELAEERGVALRTTAAEGTVVWQYPPPGRMVYKGDEMLVAVSQPGDSVMRMPDMTGLGLRKASAFLNFAHVRYAVKGTGRVVSQSIKPGDSLANDSTCLVECEQPL
ncbi:hypothetical protein C3F09_02910 [candidate division GN15 bacterium]|uniref:PASTA domain-containing protein n=1 Tax=candidate division GN15 bacterium TaxID=2072418 RepID=A0A855XB27_9BACT|nr:MAG: hypothetical protein C3F09_02910 [candidate division GN15 bacterium]